MRKMEWSKSWKAAHHPRRQRKYAAHLPLHARTRLLMSPLSKELKKRYQRNAVSVRMGDVIRILRGNHKGKTAKVERVEHGPGKIRLIGMMATRKDGTQKPLAFHASKIMITELNLSDKKREAALKRENKNKE